MTAKDIEIVLRRLGDLYIPEFTYGDLRVDAVLIDIPGRKVRGFEIKVDRGDFLKDKKWQLYSRFCSSLSVACPEGLIQPEEVSDPFGLVWVTQHGEVQWKKREKNIQHRESLAWTWTYLSVLEKELPRLMAEIARLNQVQRVREREKAF